METRKENRFEVIEDGERKFVKWGCKIEESIQDNGRTLKIFISPSEKRYKIYVCKRCDYQLKESDMGKRCPLCQTWTYHKDCEREVLISDEVRT